MNAGTVAATLLFVFAATASPGGATTLATASGAQFGFRRSVPLLAGMAAALTTLAVAASLGLAGALFSVPYLELVVRLLGTGYLLWLAWGIAHAGSPAAATLAHPRRFRAGVMMLLLNPKAWAITLSAAAAFSAGAAGPAQLALLLGSAFALCSASSLTVWCWLGRAIAGRLTEAWHWRVLNSSLALLVALSIVPMWL